MRVSRKGNLKYVLMKYEISILSCLQTIHPQKYTKIFLWRRLPGRRRSTTLDWAKQARALANLPRYRDAETITLVCDNLNTHGGDSFYAAFPAVEASRLNDRIHWVHTPKHGSWPNVAELACSALHCQCLDRRIESRALVTSDNGGLGRGAQSRTDRGQLAVQRRRRRVPN